MTPEQQAAEVLAAHAYAISTRGVECRCREFGVKYRREQWTAAEHRAHVAAALAAAGVLRDPDSDQEAVERGVCNVCWVEYQLRADGMVRHHRNGWDDHTPVCAGAGKPPRAAVGMEH